jgi:hypothetical protein
VRKRIQTLFETMKAEATPIGQTQAELRNAHLK